MTPVRESRQARAGEDAAPAPRIRLSNLDSFQQALLWRRYGPSEAIERSVAMIRSALLLSSKIVLDRNQLLDGICLLALGPAGLRWSLGIGPWAPLPLVVTGQPSAETREITVERQLSDVAAPGFLSSARAALDLEGRASGPLQWLLPDAPTPADNHLPGRRPDEPIDDAVAAAREEWAEAMRCRAVELVAWEPFDLPTHLVAQGRAVEGDHPVLGELLDLAAVRPSRGATVDFLHENRARFGDDECRCAYLWWTNVYYDAISVANDEYRISFTELEAMPTGGDDTGADDPAATHEREMQWGLRSAPRSRMELLRDRLGSRRVGGSGEIRLEGEIVENMRVISPQSFRQLLRTEPGWMAEFWRNPTNRSIYDLALAVRRSVSVTIEGRNRAVLWRGVQFLVILLAAVLLGLRDVELVPVDGGWWIMFWASLAVLAAFPWGHLKELLSLSSFSMTATLRIAGRRALPAPAAAEPEVATAAAPSTGPSEEEQR